MLSKNLLPLIPLALLAMLLTAGCAGGPVRETYARPDVSLDYIQRVAVLPVANESSDRFAGERIRDITTTILLARGIFDVVDKGTVDGAIKEEALDPRGPWTAADLKRLGQRLGVQAFLLGTINQLDEGRRGNFTFPRVGLTYRLLDTASGTVLWQASGNRSGDSVAGRLFGLGVQDDFQVAHHLASDLLAGITAPPPAPVTAPPAVAPPPAPAAPRPAEPVVRETEPLTVPAVPQPAPLEPAEEEMAPAAPSSIPALSPAEEPVAQEPQVEEPPAEEPPAEDAGPLLLLPGTLDLSLPAEEEENGQGGE